jgi:hypothetical protein
MKALNFNAQYGGLKFEYTQKPNAVVHMSFPLLIDGALANIDSVKNIEKGGFGNGRHDFGRKGESGRGSRGGDFGVRNSDFNNQSLFFLIQPGIKLETNVLRIAKLYIGVNYRIAAGKSDLVTTVPAFVPKSNQLSGLSVNFGVKIGLFGFDLRKKRHLPNLRMGKRGHRWHKSE